MFRLTSHAAPPSIMPRGLSCFGNWSRWQRGAESASQRSHDESNRFLSSLMMQFARAIVASSTLSPGCGTWSRSRKV